MQQAGCTGPAPVFCLTSAMFKQKVALYLKIVRFQEKNQISGFSYFHMVTTSGRRIWLLFRWGMSSMTHLSLFHTSLFPAWTLLVSGVKRWLHIRTSGEF